MLRDDLAGISEIDYDAGLEFLPEDDFYKKQLGLLTETLSKRADHIDDCLLKKDIEALTIEVHSLKNNAKSVGGAVLSAMSLELELAGKSGDTALLVQKVPVLTAYMRAMYAHLKGFIPEKQPICGTRTDKDEKHELLIKLRELLDSFEVDDSLEKISELKGFVLSDAEQQIVTHLDELLADFEYDDAIAAVDRLLAL